MELPVDSIHTDLSILGLLELLSSFDYCFFNFDRCSVVNSLGTGIRSKLHLCAEAIYRAIYGSSQRNGKLQSLILLLDIVLLLPHVMLLIVSHS